MPKQPYLTAPLPTTKMPPGIPYIIGNEAAERFSFYGMKGILVTFMTKYLLDIHGEPNYMNDAEAREVYHLFVTSVYFFPLFGALISDIWWGKYRTIMTLSIVYCFGHLALAVNGTWFGLDDTRLGLFLGLTLIALGSGGIKPCVSANVGDQFGKTNAHLLEKVFGWFYLSVNFGAFFSTLVTPRLLKVFPAWLERQREVAPDYLSWLGPTDQLGPHLAFGVPGLLMLLATWVFWLGRNKFVHIPPRGRATVDAAMRNAGVKPGPIGPAFYSWGIAAPLRGEGGKALLRLLPIFLFVAVFWSLFDQTGAAWVQQAEKMERHLFNFPFFPEQLRGYEALAEEIQSINPVLILVLVPFFSYIGYPWINRVFPLTPLRKITLGMFVCTLAFGVAGYAESLIDAQQTPTIWWQILAYYVLTAAEVMVSVTCLEFSYTQAPREMNRLSCRRICSRSRRETC
jgi:POT family proton-dependent oligopeptide transporter